VQLVYDVKFVQFVHHSRPAHPVKFTRYKVSQMLTHFFRTFFSVLHQPIKWGVRVSVKTETSWKNKNSFISCKGPQCDTHLRYFGRHPDNTWSCGTTDPWRQCTARCACLPPTLG